MKKIFYFLASAIVALGAMACQNEVDENINPNEQSDVVSFTVAFDEATRIAMSIEDKTAKFAFEAGDKLYVQPRAILENDEVFEGNTYEFTTEDGETFSCQSAELVSELAQSGNYAYVDSSADGSIRSNEGVDGFNFATYAADLTAETVTLSMSHAVFHFTVPEGTTATLKHTEDIFDTEAVVGWEKEMTFTEGEHWVAAWALSGTLSYSINGVVVKSIEKNFEAGKIYNLGTLDTNMTIANVAALIEKAEAGSTITLPAGATITGSEILVINKDITINGNGATFTSTAGRAINIETDGEVNISDLTVVCSGERVFNIINKPATVNISGVTATATNYAIMVATSAGAAIVTVSESTLTGLSVVNVAGAGAQVTVTNCTLNCEDNNPNESYGALALYNTADDASIVATECDINVAGDSYKAWNSSKTGTITISDGEVVNAIAYIDYNNGYSYSFSSLAKAIKTAKGDDVIVLLQDAEIAQVGTFKIDVNGKNLTAAEGYKLTIDKENKTVTVAEAPTVATIQTLIDNAEAGSTITLPAGATITGSDILVISKDITINGNGATLSSTAGRAINVSGEGVEVAISNLNIVCAGERGVNVIQNADKVTLTDVNITAANYAVNVAGSANGAVVVINGGVYNGLCTVNVGADNANVTITGATINSHSTNENEGYAALMIGDYTGSTISVKESDINISGTSKEAKSANKDSHIFVDNTEVGIPNPVAKIVYGDYAYLFETLEEALSFAKVGETVILLADAEIGKVGTFKIDLNGKKLDAADGYKIESIDEVNKTVTVIVWNPVYLAPGVWDVDGARFAAYFFDDTTNYWVSMTEEDGKFVANNTQNLPNVIFCRMKPDTTNDWSNKWSQTGDLTFKKGDTYQMVDWNCGEWATLYTKKVYVKLNNNWSSTDTKRIAAYFYNDTVTPKLEKWVAMTDMGDNIYGIEIPTDKAYKNVIFCRMNTANNTLDWGAKWDQTNNLTIPTNNNRLYTIANGAWSNGSGSWSNMLQ